MDFDAIRGDDPGPPTTVPAAYDLLKAMTVTRPLTVNRITQRDIYTVLGGSNGEIVINALESAAGFNPVVMRALPWTSPGVDHGIDICDPEVQAVFQSLVGGSVTQAMIDDIVAQKDETVLKYPGLKPGHIVDARAGKS